MSHFSAHAVYIEHADLKMLLLQGFRFNVIPVRKTKKERTAIFVGE